MLSLKPETLGVLWLSGRPRMLVRAMVDLEGEGGREGVRVIVLRAYMRYLRDTPLVS